MYVHGTYTRDGAHIPQKVKRSENNTETLHVPNSLDVIPLFLFLNCTIAIYWKDISTHNTQSVTFKITKICFV